MSKNGTTTGSTGTNGTDPTPATNSIRDTILAMAKVKTVRVQFYGQEIELRQPTMGELMESQSAPDSEENLTTAQKSARASARMLIAYAYVPETGQKLFHQGDVENIMNLPWNDDMVKLQAAMTELTGIKVERGIKNSESPQDGLTSTS